MLGDCGSQKTVGVQGIHTKFTTQLRPSYIFVGFLQMEQSQKTGSQVGEPVE
jgi:hypothetical protein